MKRSIGVIAAVFFLWISPLRNSCAQYETQKKSAGSGKETIVINGVERTVNKGAILTQKGSTTFVEGYKSNIARRLDAAENDIARLALALQAAQKEIQQLRQALSEEKKAREKIESVMKQPPPKK